MKQDKIKQRTKRVSKGDGDFGISGPSFELSKTGKIIGKILFWVIVGAIAFFFIKTGLWEYNYYKEKEGSVRQVAEEVAEPAQEVDETEVTVEQRVEYTVPADHPRYLTIEKLGIYNSRVLSMGLLQNGELDTPRNIFDVGWYNQSSKPGDGGVLVIDGHNGGPNVEGVFKHLNRLFEGDIIVIERGDGAKFNYRVVENKEVLLSEANAYMTTAFSSPTTGVEALTLISCTGEWSQIKQTYLSRQFVRAVLEN